MPGVDNGAKNPQIGTVRDDNCESVAKTCHGLNPEKLKEAVRLVIALAQLVEPEIDNPTLLHGSLDFHLVT